jgi:glycerophosphoryl diester phosphodiesterase
VLKVHERPAHGTRRGSRAARPPLVHRNSQTTDVEQHSEFAGRRTTKSIDGVSVTGWFTEDFTLAELKTLRAEERIPETRPDSQAFNGLYEVPTLQEVIDLAKSRASASIPRRSTRRTSTRSTSRSRSRSSRPSRGTTGTAGTAPVFVQSFEVANLKDLAGKTRVRLVQLINLGGKPWDFVVANDPRTYADLATPAGLREIARYAAGIGPNKNLIVPRDSANRLLPPTELVRDAHAAGLVLHPWTFRKENTFLPEDFRQGNPASPFYAQAEGDAPAEYALFYRLGIDGLFSDNPDTAVASREEALASRGN